jgi:hypothetical protein
MACGGRNGASLPLGQGLPRLVAVVERGGLVRFKAPLDVVRPGGEGEVVLIAFDGFADGQLRLEFVECEEVLHAIAEGVDDLIDAAFGRGACCGDGGSGVGCHAEDS